MQVTGKNLKVLIDSLELAEAEIHNMIATCPDVYEYSEELKEYYEKETKIRNLKLRAIKAYKEEHCI